MDREYEKDIVINEKDLKEEWERQAGLYLHYSVELAHVEKEKNKTREQLDLVKAKLDKKIRENPKDFGIAKITENVISNSIMLQEEFVHLNEIYINKVYEVSVLQGVIRAFDHKKKALENLVQLYLSGYNAEPKPTRTRRRN
jgi:hypothetical protein|tara:strand:- start:2398 stop:2823 length:426 start_codon:yes stop_codon:yes gene_type:complete